MMYSKKVLEHFMRPKNLIKDERTARSAQGQSKITDPVCGDLVKVWIWVKGGKITDCKWKSFGCAAAIASISILSEKVKGMKVNDVLKLKPEAMIKKLKLPPIKVHCMLMATKAIKAAIEDYKRRSHDKTNN